MTQDFGLTQSAAPSNTLGSALGRIAYVSLCAFVFALPWEEAVPLLGGFVIGRWLGLLAFGFAALRLMATWRGRKPSTLHYWMLGLIGWSALSFLWTVDWDSTAARVVTYLQLLAMVWLIGESAITESRVLGLLQCYVLGTCVSSLGTIANLMMGRTSGEIRALSGGGTAVNTNRYTITGFNENDLGLILALSIPMSLYLVARRKGILVTLLCWLQLGLCVTAIQLTGSRTALLTAVAALVMFPFTLPRLSWWQRVASTVACIAVLAVGSSFVPDATWRRLLKVGSEISEGTLTHRTQIWAAGVEAFRDNPFVGVGAGGYAASIWKVVDRPYLAHNTYLSILVELGVIGALLMFALLAGMLYSAIRMPYLERCLWMTLLFSWAVGVSAATWDYHKATWFLFGTLAAQAAVKSAERRAQPGYAVRRFVPVALRPA